MTGPIFSSHSPEHVVTKTPFAQPRDKSLKYAAITSALPMPPSREQRPWKLALQQVTMVQTSTCAGTVFRSHEIQYWL
jgi:hypothetical protein